MPLSIDSSLELAAQELLAPLKPSVEVEDIDAVTPPPATPAANDDGVRNDASEAIELTPEDIDALLEERLPSR
jgi:hypothetical protein